MDSVKNTTKKIVEFRDRRDWKQFHNPKDVALSLVLESTEFMEHFQWKNEKEIKEHLLKNKDAVTEELADVLYWVLLFSHDNDIDILKELDKKMDKNNKKYPEEKSKGKHTKYTEL